MLDLPLPIAQTANVASPSPAIIRRHRPLLFPRELASKGKSAQNRVRLTVSKDGKVFRCENLSSSGDIAFDKLACAPFVVARAKPARDGGGQPAYGIININIRFEIAEDRYATPPGVDLSLVVNKLPDETQSFSEKSAILSVSSSGAIDRCVPLVSKERPLDALDTVLCEFAARQIDLEPALDEAGSPVASIQMFTVEFTTRDTPLVRDAEAVRKTRR